MLLRRTRGRYHREAVLRALGAVLDEHQASGVLIMELPHGLVVQARVASYLDDGGTEPLERRFDDVELFGAAVAAAQDRGTGKRAGPLERDLRLLGRHATVQEWQAVTITQDAPGWVVHHRAGAADDLGTAVVSPQDLALIEVDAIASRRAVPPGQSPAADDQAETLVASVN